MTERLDTKMKYEGFGSHGQIEPEPSLSIKKQENFMKFLMKLRALEDLELLN